MTKMGSSALASGWTSDATTPPSEKTSGPITPGTGQPHAAAAVWREAAGPAGDVSSDVLGSSWVRVPGTAGGPSLAVVGHIDEIGVVVTHLGDDGIAAVRPVGGFNPAVMVGQRVDV